MSMVTAYDVEAAVGMELGAVSHGKGDRQTGLRAEPGWGADSMVRFNYY